MDILRIVIAIAITMAFTITLTMKSIGQVEEKPPFQHSKKIYFSDGKFPSVELYSDDKKLMPSKRLSRFLAEDQENPREASDHCKKQDDGESCQLRHGRNTTCCNNKCIDMQTDKANCGACKKKCKYTEACCRGECVNLSYDKRHCSSCNHRCLSGEYCVSGMCSYA